MRNKFDEELSLLNGELIEMGVLCENAIKMAFSSLKEGDTIIAKKVPELSQEIDNKEREIENMCLKMLLMEQPVARDLRTISSALKMVTDMERIGDNSGDIAEIVSMANIEKDDNTSHIEDMAKATIKMVTDSLDAFVRKDITLARSVIEYDDVVDSLFNEVKSELIEKLKNGDFNGEKVLDILMIAKYFERIGDHAAQIADWVLFSITGTKELK